MGEFGGARGSQREPEGTGGDQGGTRRDLRGSGMFQESEEAEDCSNDEPGSVC